MPWYVYCGCRDQIELTKDNSDIKLHLIHNDKFFNGDQYCLILDPDENMLKAEVCVEIKEHGSKFKFYPYIQMVSCFFLLLTLIVYSVVPNLLNFYSRLMRHYVVTLFMAFSILATIQLDNIYRQLFCYFVTFGLLRFNNIYTKFLVNSSFCSGKMPCKPSLVLTKLSGIISYKIE